MPRFADIIFADPSWLRALWGLPVIVLLYLIRRRASRLMVPHLPIWESVLEHMRKRRRWTRTLLSILLQLAIFTVAVLLLAGPYVEERRAGSGHTVLVIDRSLGTRAAGTDGTPLGERVMQRARALIEGAVEQGTVSLAFLSDGLRAQVTATRDLQGLLAALEDPGVGAGARDWSAVAGLRTAIGSDARVVSVSPFAPPEQVRESLRAAAIVGFAVGGVAAQAGITDVERTDDGLRVVVTGGGGQRELVLRRGPGAAPLLRVPIAPDREGTAVTIPLPSDAGARPELALLPLDGFPLDDEVPLVLPERERLRILVVADKPTPWLDAWLRASEVIDASGSSRVETNGFRDIVADYDVTILVADEQELPLPEGRYLLLGSGAPDLPIEREDRSVGAAEPVEVRDSDPLVRALDLSRFRVSEVATTRAGEGLDVVVRGTRGPLISRGSAGGVRFVDVAVRPDPKVSTLPLMAAFPLLLEAGLIELARPDRGDELPVHGAGSIMAARPGESGRLYTEDGAALPPLRRAIDGTGFVLPERPGRYLVGESDDARTIAIGLLAHPGRPTDPATGPALLPPFPEVVARVSFRSMLLWILGGLLVLEWWLWHLRATD